jgi:PAS domain S-box-containing protein
MQAAAAAMQTSSHAREEDAALRMILEGTAAETGEEFFRALVKSLARALDTAGAWVTEYIPEGRRLRALAFWMAGNWIPEYDVPIEGTPCQMVIDRVDLVHYPERIVEVFPDDRDLKRFEAVSYLGVPLLDTAGRILGHLAVLDTRPLPAEPRNLALFRIFAARAAAELRRLRAEADLRGREEELACLVNSAMDAIIELDQAMRVTRVNPAGERLLGTSARAVMGRDFRCFLSPESGELLLRHVRDLDGPPDGGRSKWITGHFAGRRQDGAVFPVEATVSRFRVRHQTFHVLILRDVNARLEAEQRIRSLMSEREYLREEVKALHNFEDIIGQSPALLRVLQDVEQVAPTQTTVLLLGETGTGKEVMARALHAMSPRKDRPFVKVNCAAVPATLIESEFFGHEKGAFTGATRSREGRFALAHGGTIFLDEVGELPLDLQAKLLRVIQEGEFEPVGSSHTRRVDVRIVAASNRDLARGVREGTFREDLYYRLNVFPICIPPLREREDDIVLLACVFAKRFAHRLGRALEPLSDDCLRRLKAYGWPGNVRELQSVIERAVITSRDGRLNLDRALPADPGRTPDEIRPRDPPCVRTVGELAVLERENLLRALTTTGWRVAGERGAARLLGMKPSTLNSRLKALGIQRPR